MRRGVVTLIIALIIWYSNALGSLDEVGTEESILYIMTALVEHLPLYALASLPSSAVRVRGARKYTLF